MKYALERLNHFVNVILNPLVLNEEKPDGERINEWIALSNREKENVKQYLLRRSLNIRKEREFELLIQQYQAEIVRLLNYVFNGKFKKAAYVKVFDAIQKDLEEILSHIEHRYTKYFNPDEKVPASYLLVTQTDLRKRIKNIKKVFAQQIADEELLQMVFQPLNLFVKAEGNVIYRQLMYVKDLICEFEELQFQADKERNLKNFLQTLVYMNFNTSIFTSYLINRIVNVVNALPEQNEKLERLAEYLKDINQMHIKPGVAFKMGCEHLREQVSYWIKEEMQYLERKQRLLSVAPPIGDGYVFADEEKLHVSVSVEVLSLFLRAGMDVRFILNKQKTPMLKLVSKYMRTIEQENISYKSMRNNWYNIEKGHKERLKDILMDMYKVVHKY